MTDRDYIAKSEFVNPTHCLKINVTERSIVASKKMLPSGAWMRRGKRK
jgi:hypothetical protein